MNEIPRRRFVKGAMAAGALLAVPRVWGAARADDALRVGVIGCGGRGRGAAQQAIIADRGAVLWALGDVFPDPIESTVTALSGVTELAPQVDVPPERRFVGFDAYQSVIDSGVDMVILAAPPHFRPRHLDAAVKKGKHVFCEKPVCVDVPGFQRVRDSIREAKSKGLNLMSGFCWRYSQPEREFVARLEAGALGKVMAIHSMYLTSPLGTRAREAAWSDMEFQLRNWQHFTWLSGDHIVEQAVHSVDKIHWFMGGRLPERCTAIGGRGVREEIPERGDSYDHFAVAYEYADGARCTLHCRQQVNCHMENTDALVGTKGHAFVNGWGPTQWIKGEQPWEWLSDQMPPNMYQVEHNELAQAIRGSRPRIVDDFMADSCLMAIMGREAAYTGRAIEWDRLLLDTTDLSPKTYEFGPMPFPQVRHPGKRVTA